MYPEWKTDIPEDIVEYILTRYKSNIDTNRIYMTGFSAGGGVALKYASHHPGVLAAIWPISPAIRYPETSYPSQGMEDLPSWFIHNRFDPIVASDRSIRWHKKLSSMTLPDIHKITIHESDSHNAWEDAYANKEQWEWLLSRKRDERRNEKQR